MIRIYWRWIWAIFTYQIEKKIFSHTCFVIFPYSWRKQKEIRRASRQYLSAGSSEAWFVCHHSGLTGLGIESMQRKNRCTLNICAPFFPVSTPDTLPKWLRGWTRCKRIFFQTEYGSRFLFFGPNWTGFFCLNEKRSHEKRSEFWLILELVLIGRFLLGLIFCIFYF